jgi:hypothetical protein
MQVRTIKEAVRSHSVAPTPLPASEAGRMAETVWGAAQLLLGLKLFLAHPLLWRRAILPIGAVLVMALLAGAASLEAGSGVALARSYGFLVGAGAVPAFLFANTYARLAADAHQLLGLGAVEPNLTTLRTRFSQIVRFALVTAIPALPVVLLAEQIPVVGRALGVGVSATWALYVTMVEQLDNGRVKRTGKAQPPTLLPWFVAWTQSPRIPGLPRRLASRFGRLCGWLAQPWVEEIALTRKVPAPALGFGGAAALLLAAPVVNLLVRPAAIIAAVHFRARTEGSERRQADPCSPEPAAIGGL